MLAPEFVGAAARYLSRMFVVQLVTRDGAEGGSRTRTRLPSTDFKSVGIGITGTYQTIRTSIYGPSGRQGIASSGYVSTRPATILAPSLLADT